MRVTVSAPCGSNCTEHNEPHAQQTFSVKQLFPIHRLCTEIHTHKLSLTGLYTDRPIFYHTLMHPPTANAGRKEAQIRRESLVCTSAPGLTPLRPESFEGL